MRAIVALDLADGIGRDGQLLQTISADLKRFKALTSGGIVIYGRKTLETFPGQKALPGRVNIMLSRGDAAPDGVVIAHSLEELDRLLARYGRQGYSADRVFVIGGESVYRALLPRCREVLVTRFVTTIPADRFFPDLAADDRFVLAETSDDFSEGDRVYRFETWRRVVADLRLTRATRADMAALVRAGFDLDAKGLVKDRRRRLGAWADADGRALFALRDGDDLVGALYTDETALADGCLSARFQLGRALTKRDLAAALETLYRNCRRSHSALLSLPASGFVDDGAEPAGLRLLRRAEKSDEPLLFWAQFVYFTRQLTAFYPFPLGLFVFRSDGEQLDEAVFLLDGQTVGDPVLIRLLADKGLVDGAGRVRSKTLKAPVTAGFAEGGEALAQDVFAWLDAYFDGRSLPLPPLAAGQLTPFQQAVSEQLKAIPAGETVSYEELAELVVGAEDAHRYARAVGQACGANPLPLFVPCHRVIGKRGELVGFSSGIPVKDFLLNHELSMRLRNVDR